MLAWILILIPIVASLVAMLLKSYRKLDLLVVLHAASHLALGAHAYLKRGSLNKMDDLGLFIFLITAVLYLMVALYRLGGARDVPHRQHRLHTIFLMLFIAAIDLACMSKDLGWIWIFIEATTLSSAMLISIEHTRHSLEAAWKYLFICSVGIALAFVGILLLVIAQPEPGTLVISAIDASRLNPFWLKLAFIFMMVGFGTKIGLAPLHFWLPDAHSEAPAPISALLSGALLNTALLPILRLNQLMVRAGFADLAQDVYLVMGFLSVFVATVFILKTRNYKRLLAYSSIENMGLVLLALGSGGVAVYAAYLHILGHSLIKAAFFLVAGNLVAIYHDKHHANVSGLLKVHPPSGWLWLLAFAMLIGMPPSPLFISEFLIATAMLANANYLGFAALMIMLACIAWSMGSIALKMCTGTSRASIRMPVWTYLAPSLLLAAAAVVGVYLPGF